MPCAIFYLLVFASVWPRGSAYDLWSMLETTIGMGRVIPRALGLNKPASWGDMGG